jgi:hypothetical protein
VTLVSPPPAGVWSLGCQCRRANAVSATPGPSQVGAAGRCQPECRGGGGPLGRPAHAGN